MKKITLILTALCAGAICAGAQSIADNEYRLRNNFWFGTDNASALAERYRGIRNDLSLSYDYENGDYHLQQNPASLNDISLSTSGVGKVGGFVLWGGFSFHTYLSRAQDTTSSIIHRKRICLISLQIPLQADGTSRHI